MRIREIAILGTLAIGMFACGESEKTEATTEEVVEVQAATYTVDNATSTVGWSGGTSGVQVYGHNGVIGVKEGNLTLEGEKLVGGSITIDMTTIQPLDSNYGAENPKEMLVGHLSSPDFFLVDSFPTANFVITSAEGNTVSGDLTIRGKTNAEKVTGVVIETTESGVKATGKLVFDRQKYDVAWAHYLQDVILSDDITLTIDLTATK